MGFIINKENSTHDILKKVKRKKANEHVLLPKDERKRILGSEFCENESFKAAGGDSNFLSWQAYSSSIKKILYEKYNFDFSRKWNINKENALHDNYDKKIDIEIAAISLK